MGSFKVIKSKFILLFTPWPWIPWIILAMPHSLRVLKLSKLCLYGCYTPPHFSVGVLCYTLRCLSVRPCSPFPIDNLSIYSRNFFKFCIHIVIGDEWYGIVNGQNLSIFNRVTALFRIGKMVSGLLFLYCS